MDESDDIFYELERMHKRIHHMMKSMRVPLKEEIASFGSFPVDVSETEDDVVIKVNLPRFSKEEISVKLTEDSVDISAQHKEKKVEKTEKMYRAERKFGAFRRFLTLPAKVDFGKSDAKFENGVLTIKVPKKEKKKVGKEIKIK